MQHPAIGHPRGLNRGLTLGLRPSQRTLLGLLIFLWMGAPLAADVQIEKTDHQASVVAGGTIEYALVVRSLDGDTDVRLSDTVPTDTAFVPNLSDPRWSGCSVEGSVCTLELGTMKPGEVISVPIAFNLGLSVAGMVTNIASVSAAGDTTPEDNTSTEQTPILGVGTPRELSLGKSSLLSRAAAGEVVPYDLFVRNNGNQDATGAFVTETVPENTIARLDLGTPGWSCFPDTGAGAECSFLIGDLAAGGDNALITFAVEVLTPIPQGVEELSNTASVDDDGSGGIDPIPTNNTDTLVLPLDAVADLSLSKSDGGASVGPGETVVYTLGLANLGDQVATGLEIVETVPAFSTFDPAASSPGWSCASGGGAGDLCTLGLATLAPGLASNFSFAVRADVAIPAGIDELINLAQASDDGAGGADPNPADNSASDTTPLRRDGTSSFAPDLFIVKTADSATTTASATLGYTLSYGNVGTQGAGGVVITEVIPAETLFNPGASSPGWTCNGAGIAGDPCTFDAGTVEVSQSAELVFAVDLVDPVAAGVEAITNTATITDDGSHGEDLFLLDNTSTVTTPLLDGAGGTSPDLSISKSDGGVMPDVGEVLTYSLGFANVGNQVATGAELVETVPEHTTFRADLSPGWSCTDGGAAGATCTFDVGTLDPDGGGGSIDFAVELDASLPPGTMAITNTVSLGDDGASGADQNAANNTVTLSTPLSSAVGPDLIVEKSDGGQLAELGEGLVYTLGVRNEGAIGATGVVLGEAVPEHTTFDATASSAGWSCEASGGASDLCTFDVGTLPADGSSFETFFAVQVAGTVPSGVSELFNSVSATDDGSNGEDLDPATNAAFDVTQILGSSAVPDLAVTLTDFGITVDAGDTFPVEASVSNGGTQGASGVRLSMLIPDGTTPDLASSTAGWSCGGGGCIFDLVGELVAGDAITVELYWTIDAPLGAGIEEAVTVASVTDDGTNGADPNTDDNEATETTPIGSGPGGGGTAPDLEIIKTSAATAAIPGQPLSYELLVRNQGNQGANGVEIFEELPAGTSFQPAGSSPGWLCLGGDCALELGSLEGGARHTARIAVDVAPGPWDPGSSLGNVAQVFDNGKGGEDPNPKDNTAFHVLPVEGSFDVGLRLIKDDRGLAEPGTALAFSVAVDSVGLGASPTFEVELYVPDFAVHAAAGGGWTCDGDGRAGDRCTQSVGPIEPGELVVLPFTALLEQFPTDVSHNTLYGRILVDDDNPKNNEATLVFPMAGE